MEIGVRSLEPTLEFAARCARAVGHCLSDLAELRARAGRRHPLLANVAMVPAMLGATVAAAAVYVTPPLVRPFGDRVVGEIVESDARRQGTALYDSKARFIGAFPSRLDSDARYNRGESPVTDTDLSGHTITIHPDHKTLFVEHPPQPYIACLKRLEDAHLSNPLINPYGIDGLGLARIGLTGGRAGGSTLSSQLVQQLIRPKEAPGGSRLATYRRKVEEIFWTVPIMYGHAPNDRRFDQMLARHLPHLQYLQNDRGTIWGIEASSQVLFGQSAQTLDPARQFILAAAVRRQIVFPWAKQGRAGLRDISAKSRRSWLKAIGRARKCADSEKVLPDPKARVNALATLASLARSLPTPHADPVIEALGRERYGVRWPERARDPFRRANIFAFYAMDGLRAELLDALGKDWSRKVAQVRMTIDVRDERRFSPKFRQEARQWLAHRPDLNPYFNTWATYANAQDEPRDAIPEVIAAVADSEGRLVRYYSSREMAPYFGQARSAQGQYEQSLEDRHMSSLGKIGSALVLLRAGADNAAARRAFAVSDTSAITAMTHAADPGQRLSRSVLSQLHWSDFASRDGAGHPLDLSFAFANGLVAASPRTTHWGALTITNALAGDERPVRAPSLAGEFRLVDLAQGRLKEPLGRLADAYGGPGGYTSMDPRALIDPAARARAILLLSAPICGGGTLRALQQWCDPKRTHLIWGKTGTLDISSSYSHNSGERHTGVVSRIAITGGVEFADGRRFAFFLSIGGVGATKPLTIARPGTGGLEASALAPLLNTMLEDLDFTPQGGSGHDR